MKQKDYRSYTVNATSRQDPSGKWRGTWSAIRMSGDQAESKSGRVTKFFRTESDCRQGCSPRGLCLGQRVREGLIRYASRVLL